MRMILCLLGLILASAALVAEEAQLPSAALEPAPGTLGEARFDGPVALGAEPGDSAIYLFDTSEARLFEFRESGDSWGKPVQLLDERGLPLKVRAPALAVNRGRLLISGLTVTGVYKLNGDRVSLSRGLPFAVDAAGLGARGWLVALAQVAPNVRLAGAEPSLLEEKTRDRLIAVDHDLDLMASSLGLDDEVPSHLAAARALELAFDGENVWAAELANYRLFRLSEGLSLEETFEEPELLLEEGADIDEEPRAEGEDLPSEVTRLVEESPTDLTTGKKPEMRPTMYRYKPVIRDLAWDPVSRQLVILLAAGGAESAPALDLMDPVTGETRRIKIEVLGTEGPPVLAQLAVTEKYLWVRNLNGKSPTYRLHRSALDRAVPVLREEPSRPATPASDPDQPAEQAPVADPKLESRVQMSFPKETPVQDLLQILGGLFFGEHVEVAPEVEGTFSGSLDGATLQEALDTICKRAGCRWTVEGEPPQLEVVKDTR